MGHPIRSLLLLGAAFTLAIASTTAATRMLRTFDHDQGLVGAVQSFLQADDRMIWVGTQAGLFRYDSVEFRRWGDARFGRISDLCEVRITGSLYALNEGGLLLHVDESGMTPSRETTGHRFRVLRTGPQGHGWALDVAGRIWTHDGSGWSARADLPDARSLFGEGAEDVVVESDGAFRILGFGGSVENLELAASRSTSAVNDLIRADENTWLLVRFAGGWEFHRDGMIIDAHDPGLRGLSCIRRGDDFWISFDHALFRHRPGEIPEEITGSSFGYVAGTLWLDHENSLWLTTGRGLSQIPEPDSLMWTADDGLPLHLTTWFTPFEDGVWISNWVNSSRLTAEGSGFRLRVHGARDGGSRACVDGDGWLWTQGADGTDRYLLAVKGDIERRVPFDSSYRSVCLTAHDGTVWFSSSDALWRIEDGAPVHETDVPASQCAWVVHESADRTLRIVCGDRLCRSRIGDAEWEGPWQCETVPANAGPVKDIGQSRDGTLWMTTGNGVFVDDGRGWALVPGSLQAESSEYFLMHASPRGGVWIANHDAAMRVERDRDVEDGWRIVELLSSWHGLGQIPAFVHEREDGALWAASMLGVHFIPPHVRDLPRPTPSPQLVRVRYKDADWPVSRGLEIPASGASVDLTVSVFSFKEPGSTRFRHRLRPGDRSNTSDASISLLGLAPGRYRPEAQASLDGASWSDWMPLDFEMIVRAPWYRRTSALALYALLVIAVVVAVQRARMMILLRLERQRLRIAHDLHDELGAGLGSINLLADLAGRESLAPGQRDEMLSRISRVTGSLSASVADIVWSLKSSSAPLRAFGLLLRERGRDFFSDDGVVLTFDFPRQWPPARLALTTRRNLQCIAVEALHNVAKHANATRVRIGLGLATDDVRHGLLTIEDDGKGLNGPGVEGSVIRGTGLDSMRRRTAEFGGSIEWMQITPHGTRIVVKFPVERAATRFA